MTDVKISNKHSPLVSIGVPVYNGGRYMEKTICSLLDQSMSNFEIIISDNASTDSTASICQNFAQRDQRIRYIRQKKNIGAPQNWNFVVHEARGVFFKWASANDYCAPQMIEKCVKAMQTDPTIVLCYGQTQLIDENDQPIKILADEKCFCAHRPSERFFDVCSYLGFNNAQCGLIRLEVLRQTRLDRMYPTGDLSLMAELVLYGCFKLVPEVFLFRRHSSDSITSMLTPLALQQVYNPEAKKPLKLIHFRRHLDNIVSISRAPISLTEKLCAYMITFRMARMSRFQLYRELLSLLQTYK